MLAPTPAFVLRQKLLAHLRDPSTKQCRGTIGDWRDPAAPVCFYGALARVYYADKPRARDQVPDNHLPTDVLVRAVGLKWCPAGNDIPWHIYNDGTIGPNVAAGGEPVPPLSFPELADMVEEQSYV